jgi:hypothetical protein
MGLGLELLLCGALYVPTQYGQICWFSRMTPRVP